MGTKHHICTSITGLLRQSDKVLARLFSMDPAEIRADLKERLGRGEKLIPSEGCDGFDPVNGCPGHPIPIPEGVDFAEQKTGEEKETIKMVYDGPVIIRDEQNLLN